MSAGLGLKQTSCPCYAFARLQVSIITGDPLP